MDITSISALVAACGVIIGIILTYLEVRSLVRTRQTDLLMQLYSMCDRDFFESYEKVINREALGYNDYKKKYGFVEANHVSAFYEGVGALLQKKLIDLSLVQTLFGTDVVSTWERFKPMTEEYRKVFNRPEVFSPFEYLYNEVKKRQQTVQTQQ